MPSPYIKKWGSGLPEQVERIGQSALDVVRVQLKFVRAQFFSGTPYPDSMFAEFKKFPFIAGYTLGLVGGYLKFRNITLSEKEVLASVLDIHSFFVMNNVDVGIASQFSQQPRSYRLGVDVADAEVLLYLAEQQERRDAQYQMLVHFTNLFIKYDDAPTLALNLKIVCDGLSIGEQHKENYAHCAKEWALHRRYAIEKKPYQEEVG